jgi:hypothetical protein
MDAVAWPHCPMSGVTTPLVRENLAFRTWSTSPKSFVAASCLAMLCAVSYAGYSWLDRYLAQARCEALLNEAMEKADAAVQGRALEFTTFVQVRSAGAKSLSEDLVSLSGSMAIIGCKVSGNDDQCFEQYVVKKFGEHLFAPQELDRALRHSMEAGAQDIELIENQLAVALRNEMVEGQASVEQLPLGGAVFKDALKTLRDATNKDLAKSAAGLAATEVASYLVGQIASRMLISSGVIAGGVANSGWTLGGSLVLGVALNELWNHITRPAQEIEKEIHREMENMAAAGSSAIQNELGYAARERKALWQKTVQGMFQ